MLVRDHQVMGDVGQMVPMRYHPNYYETIIDICARSNVVVNCVGRRFDKYGDTMEGANIKFSEDLAKVTYFNSNFRLAKRLGLKDWYKFLH